MECWSLWGPGARSIEVCLAKVSHWLAFHMRGTRGVKRQGWIKVFKYFKGGIRTTCDNTVCELRSLVADTELVMVFHEFVTEGKGPMRSEFQPSNIFI